MTTDAISIMTPVGRLVAGHPMKLEGVTDDNNQPKMKADGITQRTEAYFGIAIAKGGEQHWNQTEWGQKIWAAGSQGWPNGEFNAPTFAWKVTDGDSQIPNKNGKKPCDREGYAGHWVLNMTTGMAVRCFHANHYEPHEQIQQKEAIKPGDYIRVMLNARGNAPAKSPGVYLNPQLVELTRAGIEIQLSTGPSAAEAFGGSVGALPAGAQIDNNVATPMAQPVAQPATAPLAQPQAAPVTQPAVGVQPAPDFAAGPAATAQPAVAVEEKFLDNNGNAFTRAQLQAAGIADAQINLMQKA